MTDFQNADLTTVPTPSEEDALAFTLKGYRLAWRASGLALKRASDRGVELEDVFDGIMQLGALADEVSETGEASLDDIDADALQATTTNMLVTMARLVWLGGLHFEADLNLEAILSLVDLKSAEELPLEAMVEQILPTIEDELDSGKAPNASGES
jgi:hypothetical protein